jgi:hypothetical protein
MMRVLTGMLIALAFVGATLFLRSWRVTKDRFFALFASAFFAFALNWIGLALTAPEAEARVYLYAVRLVGFLLILAAIIDKNRARS